MATTATTTAAAEAGGDSPRDRFRDLAAEVLRRADSLRPADAVWGLYAEEAGKAAAGDAEAAGLLEPLRAVCVDALHLLMSGSVPRRPSIKDNHLLGARRCRGI